MGVQTYGHWGRPVLVFPSEGGHAEEFAERGMVAAVQDLIDAGRVKFYCVDAPSTRDWLAAPEAYRDWIVDQVVPHIRTETGAAAEIVTAGVSLGAFHALNVAFQRADLFPLALCLSGNYDPATWGRGVDAPYFHNPMAYVPNLHGDHLGWLRSRLSVLLVCGQGQWEDTTGALDATRRMAGLLAEKGIRHELDLWGHDVPHDWPSWRAQLAHHLPRFC